MEDFSVLRDQENALVLAVAELRKKEADLIKAQTLAEQIEIARVDSTKYEHELAETTAKLKDLKKQKAVLLEEVCGPLSEAITAFLPMGKGRVEVEDGKVFILWIDPNECVVPYHSLSGGQRIAFDTALSNALLGNTENKVLILEAAELDGDNLSRTLHRDHPDVQIIVNTWHEPKADAVPEGWEVTRLRDGVE